MRWSLSEFLNLLLVRGQCWGVVDISSRVGFRARAGEHILFYAVVEGSVTISGVPGAPITLKSGDMLVIMSSGYHAVRSDLQGDLRQVRFLDDDEYGDTPHFDRLDEPVTARVLCGRLKIRWPGGVDRLDLPPAITVDAGDQLIRLDRLLTKAKGSGAAAILTKAAALVITEGLRNHRDCQVIFRYANFREPISRAIQYMELHLHQHWTVGELAAKVGMARSTFAGQFLAEVGKPPMEFLTDLRMERAAGLITKTRLKLPDVAERVGYQSLSAFSRQFKAYFDVTPGKLRHTDNDGIPAAEAGILQKLESLSKGPHFFTDPTRPDTGS
jgi:AraC-like DNA-binding protein